MRDAANPVSSQHPATRRTDQDWCRPGQNFGPHNLHENRPGTFQSEDVLFATYHNAGLRIFDIRNAYAPREIDRWVAPPAHPASSTPAPATPWPPRPGDVNVQPDGTMYLSDWNAGLHVLHYDL